MDDRRRNPAANKRKIPAKDECSLEIGKAPATINASVGLLGIGPILFVSVPAETVAELGAMLKWSSPFLKTYVLYMGTDILMYMPTNNQWRWGGYESFGSATAQGSGELLVQKVLHGADALLRKDPLNLPPLLPAAKGY